MSFIEGEVTGCLVGGGHHILMIGVMNGLVVGGYRILISGVVTGGARRRHDVSSMDTVKDDKNEGETKVEAKANED